MLPVEAIVAAEVVDEPIVTTVVPDTGMLRVFMVVVVPAGKITVLAAADLSIVNRLNVLAPVMVVV